jgi:hypothetical protein
MERMLELTKSMQDEMRTNHAKMDSETKVIKATTKAILYKLDTHQEKTEYSPKERLVEFRGYRVIKQEMARRLHTDLKR